MVLKLTVPMASSNSFAALRSFTDDLVGKLAVTQKIANKVNVVIDEIYSNIANYSGADTAEIEYEISGGKLVLTFTDNGVEYNPLDTKEPDITLCAEDRKIGGLGIFMVKKMTESMEYTYEGGKNILKLVIGLG